jgi:hypothetical protein
MAYYTLDIASYQGELRTADVTRAGFHGVNLKTSHGLGQKAVHPDVADGYPGHYPGDTSSHWNAGYGGWSTLAVMQYAVEPLTFPDGTTGTIKVSKSAVRDTAVWQALTGGTVATSQNGWPVDASGSSQDRSAVAGVTFPNGVRKGDVATVLFEVARRCWGWFVKVIEGGTSVSNHASGTAIDLNAPDHPLGSRGTFSAAKVAAIRRILSDLGGVVRWGGDYSGRADEMHFEINAGAAAVKALADKIRGLEDVVTPEDRTAIAQAVASKLHADLTNPAGSGLKTVLTASEGRIIGAVKTITGGAADKVIATLPDIAEAAKIDAQAFGDALGTQLSPALTQAIRDSLAESGGALTEASVKALIVRVIAEAFAQPPPAG